MERGDQVKPKVALVCDWLTNVGGAEKLLLAIHQIYPEAPIYTSQYNPRGIDWFKDADVRTGWMQFLPAKLRRFYPMLRQFYFNYLDLSEYDVIISVTGAEAKSIRQGKAKHYCYCHVPTQYYWTMYDYYLENPGFGILNPLVRFCLKLFVRPLRKADYKAAQRPDQFIAISQHSAEMIKKYYGRDSIVINPPVETEVFKDTERQQTTTPFFINFSRQVSWKRQDIAIEACLESGDKLALIGDGPENRQLQKLAGEAENIRFCGQQPSEEIKRYLSGASAFIFPSIEPFGIAPIEALAAGCPVIALNQGGARDFIVDGENGVLFEEQTAASLREAINRFKHSKFDEKKVRASAERFSVERFKKTFKKYIDESYKK